MRAIPLVVVAALLMAACSPSLAAPSGVWQPATSRPAATFQTQFVALPNDRVLALGGGPNLPNLVVSATALIYDASSDSWSEAPPIPEARAEAAITIVRAGATMVIGGTDGHGSALRSAYLFDPNAESWTREPDMQLARSAPTAVTLADGRVLVVGGAAGWTGAVPAPDDLADAEVFDPDKGSWSAIPPIPTGGVVGPSARVLNDGRVLVAGGDVQNSAIDRAALYDPARNTWHKLPNMPQPRSDATLELVSSGQVVMMGGNAFAGSPEGGGFTINPALDSEFFDSGSMTWHLGTTPQSRTANNFLARWVGAAALKDGRMLVVGTDPSLAFTYDPGADFWQSAGRAPQSDFGTTLVTMSDGRVLDVSSQTAWIYDPTRSPAAPATNKGWMDSFMTTLVLLVLALAMALAALWRRLR